MTRLVLVLTLLGAGCSFTPRGFDHGALARAARVDRHSVSDADIAGAVSLQPQLRFPLRLAIWFRPPIPWSWSEYRFHWQREDRRAILDALRPLVDAGVVSEPVTLADSVFPGEGVRAARYAAALHNADAVLIVTGASALERHSNPAALLYATVLGLWIAPGSHAEGICLATASLWDVRSGFLYAAAEREGTAGETAPILDVDEEKVIAGAKQAALGALAQDLELRLARLKEAATASASAR